MRKKVGAKKVGGEREGRSEEGKAWERVLGAWRVAAAKGQVPRQDEDGAAPPGDQGGGKEGVGNEALSVRLRYTALLALCLVSSCSGYYTVLRQEQTVHVLATSHSHSPSHTHVFSSKYLQQRALTAHRHVALSASTAQSGLPAANVWRRRRHPAAAGT